MNTIEEIQDKLRECINHAYRDKCEDIQTFGSNIEHLDKAITLLNELVEICKAEGAYGYVVRYGCNKERLNHSMSFIIYADNEDAADAYIDKYVKDEIDEEKHEDDDGNIVNWWWKYYSIDKTPLSEFGGNFVNVVWLKWMNKKVRTSK